MQNNQDLRILVVDDSPLHQKSALLTLNKHKVTTVGDQESAYRQLHNSWKDEEELARQLKKRHLPSTFREAIHSGSAKKEEWQKQHQEIMKEHYQWDVVLSDLLMPAGKILQGANGIPYVGQEMPIGWALALYAALQGARLIAVVTDIDHHDHPASALLDLMKNRIFMVEQAHALFTNNIRLVEIPGTETTCTECDGSGKHSFIAERQCSNCDGKKTELLRGKDWGDILKRLLEHTS